MDDDRAHPSGDPDIDFNFNRRERSAGPLTSDVFNANRSLDASSGTASPPPMYDMDHLFSEYVDLSISDLAITHAFESLSSYVLEVPALTLQKSTEVHDLLTRASDSLLSLIAFAMKSGQKGILDYSKAYARVTLISNHMTMNRALCLPKRAFCPSVSPALSSISQKIVERAANAEKPALISSLDTTLSTSNNMEANTRGSSVSATGSSHPLAAARANLKLSPDMIGKLTIDSPAPSPEKTEKGLSSVTPARSHLTDAEIATQLRQLRDSVVNGIPPYDSKSDKLFNIVDHIRKFENYMNLWLIDEHLYTRLFLGSIKNREVQQSLSDAHMRKPWSELKAYLFKRHATKFSTVAQYSLHHATIVGKLDYFSSELSSFLETYWNSATLAGIPTTGTQGAPPLLAAFPELLVTDVQNRLALLYPNMELTYELAAQIADTLWSDHPVGYYKPGKIDGGKPTSNPAISSERRNGKVACPFHPTGSHGALECNVLRAKIMASSRQGADQDSAASVSVRPGSTTRATSTGPAVVGTRPLPPHVMCDNCGENHLLASCKKPHDLPRIEACREKRAQKKKEKASGQNCHIWKLQGHELKDHLETSPYWAANTEEFAVDPELIGNFDATLGLDIAGFQNLITKPPDPLPIPLPDQESDSVLGAIEFTAGLTIRVHDNEDTMTLDLEHPITGKRHSILALVDSGCTRSYITDTLAKVLGLPTSPANFGYRLADGSLGESLLATAPISLFVNSAQRHPGYIFPVLRARSSTCHVLTIGKDLFKDLGILLTIPSTRAAAAVESGSSLGRLTLPTSGRPNLPREITPVRSNKAQSINIYQDALNLLTSEPNERPSRVLSSVLKDSVAKREKMMSLLKPYLEENQRVTQSTREKPVFIDHPLAQNIRVTHPEGTAPKFTPQYNLAEFIKVACDKQVDEWWDTGKIEEMSPSEPKEWSSPLLGSVTHKPDGSIAKIRICADYRKVNDGLVCDNYGLPPVTEFARQTFGLRKSEFDLSQAFFQMSIHPDDRTKLAFQWRGKFYKFVGAPFGLAFMSSTMQRVLEEIFHDMPFVKVFVDGCFVDSDDDFGVHLDRCIQFIKRCNEKKIRLNIFKTQLFMDEIVIVGHTIDEFGISISKKKKAMVAAWREPTNYEQLAFCVGFLGFIRNFIPKFTDLIRPLQLLNAKGYLKPRVSFAFPDECRNAFAALKSAVTNSPRLNHYDFSKPFAISTDASDVAVGGVLFQPSKPGELPTPENIVDFQSRALRSYETRYPMPKKEALALVWAVDSWYDFLAFSPIEVHVDATALTYFKTQKVLNRTLSNWFHVLSMINILKIYYVNTKDNIAADFQTRMPLSESIGPSDAITADDQSFRDDSVSHIQLALDAAEAECIAGLAFVHEEFIGLTKEEVGEKQRKILEEVHKTAGHHGIQGTYYRLLKLGHNWPGMRLMLKSFVESCKPCQLWTTVPRRFTEIVSTVADYPWQHVQIDFCTSLKETTSGNRVLLVLVDLFSGYRLLRAMPSKESSVVCSHLTQIFSDLGPPVTLQSDNDKVLVSKIIDVFYKYFNVEIRHSTPYSHRSNGKVENAIRSTHQVIMKLLVDHGAEWDLLVPLVQLSLNNRLQDFASHKMSPFSIMFNRECPFYRANQPKVEFPDTVTDAAIHFWTENLREITRDIIPFVKELISQRSMKYELNFRKDNVVADGPLIPVGTTVMLYDHNRTSKDQSPWLGPYFIKSASFPDDYTIADSETGTVLRRHVRLDELRRLDNAVPSKKLPGTFISYVDFISDSRIRNGMPEYLVRWVGHDASMDEWLPSSEFNDVALIADFNKRRLSKKKGTTASTVNTCGIGSGSNVISASTTPDVGTIHASSSANIANKTSISQKLPKANSRESSRIVRDSKLPSRFAPSRVGGMQWKELGTSLLAKIAATN